MREPVTPNLRPRVVPPSQHPRRNHDESAETHPGLTTESSSAANDNISDPCCPEAEIQYSVDESRQPPYLTREVESRVPVLVNHRRVGPVIQKPVHAGPMTSARGPYQGRVAVVVLCLRQRVSMPDTARGNTTRRGPRIDRYPRSKAKRE